MSTAARGLVVAIALSGCWNWDRFRAGASQDLAACASDACADLAIEASTDMGDTGADASVDLSMPPVVTTPHDLDTNMVAAGTLVSVSDVIVVAPTIQTRAVPASQRCQYIAFVQEPAQSAPNGLAIFASIPNCTLTDLGTCSCPATTGTVMDQLTTIGDRFTLVGTYATYGSNPVAHQLGALVSATKTGSGFMVSPVSITSVTGFQSMGASYVTYESMLVSLHPSGGITISTPDSFGSFSGAGVTFSGYYRATYSNGGTFPAGGTNFTTIIGVADPADPYNVGSIVPRLRADFSP